MLLFSEYPDKSHNFTPYSYHIWFLTIPPHLQLISSTTTTPKCTLRSVLSLSVFIAKPKMKITQSERSKTLLKTVINNENTNRSSCMTHLLLDSFFFIFELLSERRQLTQHVLISCSVSCGLLNTTKENKEKLNRPFANKQKFLVNAVDVRTLYDFFVSK